MTLLDAWREFERNVLPADMPTATRSKVWLAFQLGASEVVDRVIEREIDGEAFVEFYVEIQQELALVARALIEAARATAEDVVCIHKWIGLASGGFRCALCDAEIEG